MTAKARPAGAAGRSARRVFCGGRRANPLAAPARPPERIAVPKDGAPSRSADARQPGRAPPAPGSVVPPRRGKWIPGSQTHSAQDPLKALRSVQAFAGRKGQPFSNDAPSNPHFVYLSSGISEQRHHREWRSHQDQMGPGVRQFTLPQVRDVQARPRRGRRASFPGRARGDAPRRRTIQRSQRRRDSCSRGRSGGRVGAASPRRS